MANVVFYEKQGCSGNARQKAILIAAGHSVMACDLRSVAWSKQKLLHFFGDLPVTGWFNPSAPAIKQGLIKPEQLDAETALDLLCEQPLLIRRPLMEIAGRRLVGFDTGAVHAWIGLGSYKDEHNLDRCAHGAQKTVCADPYAQEKFHVEP